MLRPGFRARRERRCGFPVSCPDGRHFLYTSLPADSSGKLRICVGSLDGAKPRVVLRAEAGAIYAESGLASLPAARQCWRHSDSMPSALKLIGDPVPLGDLAQNSQFSGASSASASRSGVLAFATFDIPPVHLEWLDFRGNSLGTVPGVVGGFVRPLLSPDEHRVLLNGIEPGIASYIAVADLDRGVVSRLTPETIQASEPLWSPDARSIAYLEDSKGASIVVRSLEDETRHEYVTNDPAFKRLDDWTPDGRGIVYERLDSATKWDVWLLPLDGSGPPRPLLHSTANEERCSLSPNGRWLAFQSDESGAHEVYVVPFGSPGARYQLTNGGGFYPIWRRDGAGILFFDPRRPVSIMQCDLQPGPGLSLGAPHEGGRVPDDLSAGADFSRDGKRLLTLRPAEKPRPQTVTVLQNWTSALRKP